LTADQEYYNNLLVKSQPRNSANIGLLTMKYANDAENYGEAVVSPKIIIERRG